MVEVIPQDGFDQVEVHRTVALVVSPYTQHGAVDSTCYNQTGLVKTIELMPGLPPMNRLDLSAAALRACLQPEPDLTIFTAPSRIALDEKTPPLEALRGEALHWAKASLELDHHDAEEAEDDTFNRIPRHAAWGDGVPYPSAFVGTRE